ncbi:hypothetical protein O6P43_023337 [Quillaja saponaria]|uniref:Uncharacterized protein n=1 Tax=Quillaja saponaria TaxID=32244 RepID=A0AAD7LEZ5_QUISA|nr:hypothetical protein O6P43_023337 [Quillaja saponaria]
MLTILFPLQNNWTILYQSYLKSSGTSKSPYLQNINCKSLLYWVPREVPAEKIGLPLSRLSLKGAFASSCTTEVPNARMNISWVGWISLCYFVTYIDRELSCSCCWRREMEIK